MDIFTVDKLPSSYAICLVGHGSRDTEGAQEFLTLSQKLQERKFCSIVEPGFLEFAKPTAADALSACQRNSVKNIIILPCILFSGEHTKKDIPHIVGQVFQNYPENNLIFAEPLATQPKVIEACQKRIEEEEKNSLKSISRINTMFITIGHGTRDKDYNSKVEKVLALLGEKMGFGKTLVHFAGTPQQYLDDIQEKFSPQEFQRVILFPFFLFSGVWRKRVHDLADTFQNRFPGIEILKTPCLSHHSLIVDALVQRARESISNKIT
ncbi:MAG: sirohydrochlorin chelatase [Nitrospinae bacterium]|nr:sirohydrochlorin chelatase [Nitrospinota bacterium]